MPSLVVLSHYRYCCCYLPEVVEDLDLRPNYYWLYELIFASFPPVFLLSHVLALLDSLAMGLALVMAASARLGTDMHA